MSYSKFGWEQFLTVPSHWSKVYWIYLLSVLFYCYYYLLSMPAIDISLFDIIAIVLCCDVKSKFWCLVPDWFCSCDADKKVAGYELLLAGMRTTRPGMLTRAILDSLCMEPERVWLISEIVKQSFYDWIDD